MTSKTTKQDPVPQATENRDLEIWMRLPFADYVIKLKKMICSARERGFSPVFNSVLRGENNVAIVPAAIGGYGVEDIYLVYISRGVFTSLGTESPNRLELS